jgi:hypothetical protein
LGRTRRRLVGSEDALLAWELREKTGCRRGTRRPIESGPAVFVVMGLSGQAVDIVER